VLLTLLNFPLARGSKHPLREAKSGSHDGGGDEQFLKALF
jgi:hypothetical protein